MRLAYLPRFFEELLGFIPSARLEGVICKHEHGDDPRGNRAAITRIVNHAAGWSRESGTTAA